MIIGFGNDLCDIRRIEDSLARFGECLCQMPDGIGITLRQVQCQALG